MASKKKVATTVVALTTAAALLLGGTFAWQSISQRALNEASDEINPGGRLHDDFDGSDKNVYVENFATEDIYARVRFDEYMEIVMNYDSAAEKTEIVTAPATKTDLNTYRTHLFGDEQSNPTDDYWNWTMGSADSGAVYYMPTFNLNKDSLAADVNGVFNGANFEITDRDGNQYAETYVEWTDGATKEGYEIYDGDTNNVDELSQRYGQLKELTEAVNDIIDNGNFADYEENLKLTDEQVTHTAAQVNPNTGFLSMAEWLALPEEEQKGPFWVYDTDGWCYWAQPIGKGKTTGLLMDGIELNGAMDDTWYYAINVVGQFVTADDAGKADNTGFYDTNAGTAPTENAEKLLEAIGVTLSDSEAAGEALRVEYSNGGLEVEDGVFYISTVDFADFDAYNAENELVDNDVTWSLDVSEGGSMNCHIDYDGWVQHICEEACTCSGFAYVVATDDSGNTATSKEKVVFATNAVFLNVDGGMTTNTEQTASASIDTTFTVFLSSVDGEVLAVDETGLQTTDPSVTVTESEEENTYIVTVPASTDDISFTLSATSTDGRSAKATITVHRALDIFLNDGDSEDYWYLTPSAEAKLSHDAGEEQTVTYSITYNGEEEADALTVENGSLVWPAKVTTGKYTVYAEVASTDLSCTKTLYVIPTTISDVFMNVYEGYNSVSATGTEKDLSITLRPGDAELMLNVTNGADYRWFDWSCESDYGDLYDADGYMALDIYGGEADAPVKVTATYRGDSSYVLTLTVTFEEPEPLTISIADAEDSTVTRTKSYTLSVAEGYSNADNLVWDMVGSGQSTLEGNGASATLTVGWKESDSLTVTVFDTETWREGELTLTVADLTTHTTGVALYSGETELTTVAPGSSYANLSVKLTGSGDTATEISEWMVVGQNSTGTIIDQNGNLTIGYFESSAELQVLAYSNDYDGEPFAFPLSVEGGNGLTDISSTYALATVNDEQTQTMVLLNGHHFAGSICDDAYAVELEGFVEHETTLEAATKLTNLKSCELVGPNLNTMRLTGTIQVEERSIPLGVSEDGTYLAFRTANNESDVQHTLYVITSDNEYIAYTFDLNQVSE